MNECDLYRSVDNVRPKKDTEIAGLHPASLCPLCALWLSLAYPRGIPSPGMPGVSDGSSVL